MHAVNLYPQQEESSHEVPKDDWDNILRQALHGSFGHVVQELIRSLHNANKTDIAILTSKQTVKPAINGCVH